MKNSIHFAIAGFLALASSNAFATNAAIECRDAGGKILISVMSDVREEFVKFTNSTHPEANAENGFVSLGSSKFRITEIDTSSETTRMLYNGDFFRRSWPVTIVRASNEQTKENIELRYFADSGSKNGTDGSVVLRKSGQEINFDSCKDGIDF